MYMQSTCIVRSRVLKPYIAYLKYRVTGRHIFNSFACVLSPKACGKLTFAPNLDL